MLRTVAGQHRRQAWTGLSHCCAGDVRKVVLAKTSLMQAEADTLRGIVESDLVFLLVLVVLLYSQRTPTFEFQRYIVLKREQGHGNRNSKMV